jgi:hypothetical protein
MQAEWQRLHDATSDEEDLTTPSDHAWQAYSEDVWPRTALQPKGCTTQDVPALLLTHPATALEGLRQGSRRPRDGRGGQLPDGLPRRQPGSVPVAAARRRWPGIPFAGRAGQRPCQ